MPAAIERRGDERIGIAIAVLIEAGVAIRRAHGDRVVAVRKIDECCELLLERTRIRLRPVLVLVDDRELVGRQARARHAQRAAELQHAGERGIVDRRQILAGIQHVDVTRADPRIDGPRL